MPSLALAASLSFAAVPAAAQEGTAEAWQYAEGAESCRASRTLGDGRLVQLRSFGPGSAVELTVADPQVPREPHSARMVELGWSGRGFDKHQVGVLGSIGGVPGVSLLTTHRDVAAFARFFSETAVVVSPLDPIAETLQLRVVGSDPREVRVGTLAEPVRRLAECEESLMERWGWGRDYARRVATASKMRDPQRWFHKAIVYPAVPNLKRVSSRLKVGTDGKVAECVVQSSLGSSQFGEKNCTGLRRQARFDPALGPDGQAVESYMQLSITFARYD